MVVLLILHLKVLQVHSIHNEQIALDEAPTSAIGTIDDTANDGVTDFQFTDCKSFYKSGFTADLILDVQQQLLLTHLYYQVSHLIQLLP